MKDFTKPLRDDVDDDLLAMSKRSEKNGCPSHEIESVENMTDYIREEMTDMLSCSFLRKKAIEELISDLEKEKLLVFDL